MLRLLAGGGNVDAVIAVGGATGGVIIGHAMAASSGPAGPGRAEIGVVVTDAWQGQGVGSALLRALISRARARGVTGFEMEVLAENRRVLTMIAGYWPAAQYERAAAYVTVQTGFPRYEEERRGERLVSARWPGPGEPAGRGRRQRPQHPAAHLQLGGPRRLSGCRP
jgi:GNAT superfamily N-acetyltransferase